jgi:hypothetical protein
VSGVESWGRGVNAVLRELQKFQARLMLNRYVGRDLSLCLGEDDAVLDQVVEAVLSQWKPGTDVAELWESYANRVEHADDGSDDEYRATPNDRFSPDGSDVDRYLRDVWLDHLSQLGRANAA